MSKSLGNVIDPLDSLAEYGADALRFTLATGTTPGQVSHTVLSSVPSV
jgi:valyl-tRNA synthetase